MSSAARKAQVSEWFVKWHKPIRKWLRERCEVPTTDLDDLAVEVFERLLRYDSQEVVDNPGAYLFRIARNVSAEYRDRARMRFDHSNEWLDTLVCEAETCDPEHMLQAIQDNDYVCKLLHKVIDSMPTRRGYFLLLHVNDKLTYKEIAEQNNVSYRLVLRELSRAYSQLREDLEPFRADCLESIGRG